MHTLVLVVDGTYDEVVARSAAEADSQHLVISDTVWPGYQTTPRHVIDGYTILQEIGDQLAVAVSANRCGTGPDRGWGPGSV